MASEASRRDTVRLLVLNGGGLRGVFSLQLLRRLEQELGRPLREAFDLIVGTSTGGLLSFGISLTDMALLDLQTAYHTMGVEVFGGSDLVGAVRQVVVGSWHKEDILEKHITTLLTPHNPKKPLSEFHDRTPVAVVATRVDCFPGKPYLFRNYPEPAGSPWEGTDGVPVVKAAYATSAAPFYLKPMSLKLPNFHNTSHLVDGGLLANNPVLVALLEAKAKFGPDPRFVVVNIGTGFKPALDTGIEDRWLTTQLSVTLSAAMSTLVAQQGAKAIVGEDNFFNIDGPILHSDMDEPKYLNEWEQSGNEAALAYNRWDALRLAMALPAPGQ